MADIPALRRKAAAAFPSGHPVRTLLESIPDTLTPDQIVAIGPSIMALAATPKDKNDARAR